MTIKKGTKIKTQKDNWYYQFLESSGIDKDDFFRNFTLPLTICLCFIFLLATIVGVSRTVSKEKILSAIAVVCESSPQDCETALKVISNENQE